jgi:predicted transcriptional regulator
MAGWEERMFFWMRLYGRVDDLICNLLKKKIVKTKMNERKLIWERKMRQGGRERERKKSVRN